MRINNFALAMVIATANGLETFLGGAGPTECRNNRAFDTILIADDTCIGVLNGIFDYTYYAVGTMYDDDGK